MWREARRGHVNEDRKQPLQPGGRQARRNETIVPNGRWYVKAYSQYRLGGPPSEGLAHGPIVVTGPPISTLLSTQGCGTAQRFGHRTERPSLQEGIARSYHAVYKRKARIAPGFSFCQFGSKPQ